MKMYYVTRLFFENLIRDKFFSFVFISGAFFGAFSIILNEISYGATEMIVRSFCLGFVSITINFLSIYFGLSLLSSDGMRHSIVVLLCKPLRRSEIIIGSIISYVAAVFIAMVFISFELYLIMNLYNVVITELFLYGLLGIFFEGIIIFLIAMLLKLFLSNLISVLFTFCIYLIGHGVRDVLELGFFQQQKNLAIALKYISKIFPDLSYFDLKSIVYNSNIHNQSLINGATYFISTFVVITTLICISFSNRDYE